MRVMVYNEPCYPPTLSDSSVIEPAHGRDVSASEDLEATGNRSVAFDSCVKISIAIEIVAHDPEGARAAGSV